MKSKIRLSAATKQVRGELNTLTEVMEGYEKWVTSTQGIAEDSLDIYRQIEQCKVSSYLSRWMPHWYYLVTE